MSSWSKPWSDCPPCPALVQLPQFLQTQLSTSSSICCREDFCPNSLCFCSLAKPCPLAGVDQRCSGRCFSPCVLGTAVFFTNPAPEASWHFLEVPRRTPEPEPCLGRTHQSKGVWCAVTAGTCVGGSKGHVKPSLPCSPQPPVLSAGALRPWQFPSASEIFSICLSHPAAVLGRWNRAGAITGLCC